MAASTCSVVLVLFVLVGSCLMAAEAGLIGSLLGLINIQGTLFCTANGNVNVNGTATPVFPNALVQLKCGSSGNVVASSTTNQSGLFSIVLEYPLPLILLNSLLTDCNLVVDTPLANCNANLPNVASALTSALQFFGNFISGSLKITNLVPIGFQYIST
ncbi:hypothetical protein ACFE04_015574 [Oxalis oulophora]